MALHDAGRMHHRFIPTRAGVRWASAVPPWPVGARPSPYEVLNLQPSPPPSGRDIKRAYYALAKVYHPDTAEHPEAAARFRTLLAAYELLADHTRRKAYDTQRYGWDASGTQTQRRWTPPPPSDPYWQRATWEDHQHAPRREPPDHTVTTLVVVGVAMCVAGAQIAAAYADSTEAVPSRASRHGQAALAVRAARENRGMGWDQALRIERFLHERRHGVYGHQEEALRRHEREDRAVLALVRARHPPADTT